MGAVLLQPLSPSFTPGQAPVRLAIHRHLVFSCLPQTVSQTVSTDKRGAWVSGCLWLWACSPSVPCGVDTQAARTLSLPARQPCRGSHPRWLPVPSPWDQAGAESVRAGLGEGSWCSAGSPPHPPRPCLPCSCQWRLFPTVPPPRGPSCPPHTQGTVEVHVARHVLGQASWPLLHPQSSRTCGHLI